MTGFQGADARTVGTLGHPGILPHEGVGAGSRSARSQAAEIRSPLPILLREWQFVVLRAIDSERPITFVPTADGAGYDFSYQPVSQLTEYPCEREGFVNSSGLIFVDQPAEEITPP